MYRTTKTTEFICQYCNRKFLVSDFNNDIEETQHATHQHQIQCRNKIKICLGDVFIFNITQTTAQCPYKLIKQLETKISPPMKVIYVDISDPLFKVLHVVLTKFNNITKTWEVDQKAMQYYKNQFNIDYFTMYQYQINRQINLNDFKESFKIVESLDNWIKDVSIHTKKKSSTEINYDFSDNNIILTIKVPYKTKSR